MYVGCLKGTDIHVTHMLVNSTTIILLEKKSIALPCFESNHQAVLIFFFFNVIFLLTLPDPFKNHARANP